MIELKNKCYVAHDFDGTVNVWRNEPLETLKSDGSTGYADSERPDSYLNLVPPRDNPSAVEIGGKVINPGEKYEFEVMPI